MIFKSFFPSPSEILVAPAKSFVIASRMMSLIPDDRYQSTAARNDGEKSVFASEPCQNDRTMQIIIARNNQRYTKTSSDTAPTSVVMDLVQIWPRECKLESEKKNEQMASKSHLHEPNSDADAMVSGP